MTFSKLLVYDRCPTQMYTLDFSLLHPVDGHNQQADYSATFQGVWQAKKKKQNPKQERRGLCFSLVYGTLDTKVSGVLVTVPSIKAV